VGLDEDEGGVFEGAGGGIAAGTAGGRLLGEDGGTGGASEEDVIHERHLEIGRAGGRGGVVAKQ